MGILNVTPDSFSDGGERFAADAAVAHALRMIEDGADLIDIGPESTRPGAIAVPADEQLRRAISVIESIRSRDQRVPISIDTRSARVAETALRAGADIVNDVSALRDDPDMARVAADQGAGVVLMHRRGTSLDMQLGGGPEYQEVVGEICDFLQQRRDEAVAKGVQPERILFDPGIGFGKRVEHNLTILRNLNRFAALGRPLVVGVSRKSFIGRVLGIDDPRQRDTASLACAVLAVMTARRPPEDCSRLVPPRRQTDAEASPPGLVILRVHDVAAAAQAARLMRAVFGENSP